MLPDKMTALGPSLCWDDHGETQSAVVGQEIAQRMAACWNLLKEHSTEALERYIDAQATNRQPRMVVYLLTLIKGPSEPEREVTVHSSHAGALRHVAQYVKGKLPQQAFFASDWVPEPEIVCEYFQCAATERFSIQRQEVQT